jgi:tellurite resistance protein TehA-like permease
VPVLIASIFRQKDNRFLHVASFVVSTWSVSFPFSRMMSCSEDLYHVWNRTIISYLQVMLTYAKVCSIMLKYAL